MEPQNDRSRAKRSILTDGLGRLSIRCAQVLVVLALVAVVVWVLVQIKLVVIPLLIAMILAAAIGPAVNWLRRRGVPSLLATWLTFLAGLGLFAGVAALVVFAVRGQWEQLASSFDEGVADLQDLLLDGPIPIEREQVTAARESAADFLTSRQFGDGALAGLSMAVQLFTSTLLVVVILFFLLKDGGRIWDFVLRRFDGEREERGRRIGHAGLRVLGGYLRGTAVVALVDAVVIGVALAILQIPLALPLAVVIFLTAFIPVVGATLGGAFAAVVALVAEGPVVALVVVAIVFVVNQLEGNLLQPLVMGNAVRLHPLVIVVALTSGTVLAGIPGAVLAVPVTATAWAIAKVWRQPAVRDTGG